MESLVPTPYILDSRIAECNSEGILAYASWKNVVLVNITVLPPVFLHFLEHHGLVTALSFSRGQNPSLLVSACEDGILHVWDSNHAERARSWFDTSTKVVAVEWKCNADDIVFSSDEHSCILEWNISTCTNRSLKTRSKNFVVVLSSCPHDPNLLAAGHKSGDISIIDISASDIRYKLRAHTDDITHISWSVHFGEQLLSTSKDNSICVWSLEKSDILHVFPSVTPAESLFSAQWHPEDPNLIICSSQNFVGTWDMESEGKPTIQHYCPTNGMRHSRPVALVDVSKTSKNIVFSISLDRRIIFWDIEKKMSVYQLATLSGSVFDLAFSTVAVGRLAVAVGDSNVRVWNVASSTTCPTESLYVGTKSKVFTVAWHPNREDIIAFGTDDGTVGLIDIKRRKTVNICTSLLHKTKVNKICWGPCHLKTRTTDLCNAPYLYSCGDGPIFIHLFGDEVEETVDFDELRTSAGLQNEGSESSHHTEISWKPDFSCLAVGNDDGCIEIYHGSTFALMARLKAQKKPVQSLHWHPTFTSLSSSPSALSTWLACASYETTIYIYDLSNIITKPDSNDVVEVLSATRELVGHSRRVTSLVWSPHFEGQLASASCDCSAQVWDVISGETLANFRGHKARIFSIAWNVLHPDIIFSGGDDKLVLQWRISEQTHCQPPSKGRIRRPKKKKIGSTERLKALVLTDENDPVIDGSEFQGNEDCASEVNNQTAEATITAEPAIVTEDGGQGVRTESRPRNLMPLFGSISSQYKSKEILYCAKLVEIFSSVGGKNELMSSFLLEGSDTAHLAFFGNQEMGLRWLNVEGVHHREVGNFQCAYELEVWKGNHEAALSDAAERGVLNENLLAVAPTVSYSFWLEMCERYGKQLVQEKSFQEAAFFLVSCGKIYEAIDILKSEHYYRDALAIAKARLPSSDPVIEDIICAWSAKLQSDGRHVFAAQWNVALNKPLKAASLLNDSDAEHLELAAYICSKFGYLNETEKYGLLCLKRSMLDRKWDTARHMIEDQSTMNVYKTVIAVHESVMTHLSVLKNETRQCGITGCAIHNYYYGVPEVIWRSYMVGGQNFLVLVFHSLLSQGFLPTEQEKLLEEIEAVRLLKEKPGESHVGPNQAMMYASIDLTLFFLTLLLEKEEKFVDAANYLNSLFKNCVPSNYHGLLNNICLLSLPFGILFNAEDLVLNLRAVGMVDEVINQFFMWLMLKIREQNLLSPVCFSGGSGLESPETLLSTNIIQETKKNICALSSVESILAYFFMNLLIELKVLISENKFYVKCYHEFHVESEDVSEENTEETVGEPRNDISAFRNVVESPSSHSQCLHFLKFYFYFIHRIATSLCNDNYALPFYLKEQLKKMQNDLASRAVARHVDGAPTLTGPPCVSEKGDSVSQIPYQNVMDTGDSAGPALQSDGSSQQLNSPVVTDRAIIYENEDVEKAQKCERLDIVSMQKTVKEITDLLEVSERNLLFPDAIYASSQILELCNLLKEASRCQCIDEKLTEFISQITSWAMKFDIDRSLPFKSSVGETGDH